MKSSSFFCKSTIAFFLFCITSGLNAQEQTQGSVFIPQVGQAGKDVIWVPTPDELVIKMLDIAKVTSNDYLIDLGSGDGRTVIAAARRGARALGIEYNPEMVELSKMNAKKADLSEKAAFIKADLFETDLSKATVITMFLLPDINLKLRPKLLDLKPGTRIVSNTFNMGDWTPDYEVTTEENWNSWNTALLWIVPAKIEGTWILPAGELNIHQEFQMFYGTLITSRGTSIIKDGRLNGDEITFRIDGETYNGRVIQNNMMSGTLTSGSKTSNWQATKK